MSGRGHNGSHLEDRLRLVIVDSPHIAAPLVEALDVAAVGAWMWVEAEHALYFSPRVLNLLGIDMEPQHDLLARFLRGVHAEDQPAVAQILNRKAPAGPFELRYRFTPAEGPLRWIEDRGRVVRDASGQLVRQGGAMRDVTREVGHELERREADARLEALLNAMPCSVWGRGGPALAVTHQNAHSIAWWGDLRGRPLSEAPPDVRRVWEAQIAEVMTGQITRSREEYVRGGEPRVINEIIAPVIIERQVTGVVGVGIDVTEEERARRFETLLTQVSADLASRSSDTLDAALTAALERVARFLGAPIAVLAECGERERLRLTHWWIDSATGRDRPTSTELDGTPLHALILRMAANEPVLVRRAEDLPAGSDERAFFEARGLQSVAMAPTRESDGIIVVLGLAAGSGQHLDWPADTVPLMRLAATLLSGVLARLRAEANQKLIERRMQEAQKLESLGVLAGGIAHDFNNLLTAILGNASLLRAEAGEPSALSGPLDQIEAASRRAAELCRQMLAYAGRGRFSMQRHDLNEVVQNMHALMQVSVPKKATLTLDLGSRLPAVIADEAQLRQLIMNLLINAAEAIGEHAGQITISTSAGHRTSEELMSSVFSPDLAEGDYVSLRVSDTGEGMAPDVVARIFDPFFSTRFIGRGLGLAAVVGIVRAHSGGLRVESRQGHGSTFELLLPAQSGQARPEPILPPRPVVTAPWRTSGTVLVIDDEAGVRDLVRNVLERSGLTVLIADDGERGVEMFRAHVGDVRAVLVDLTMPGLDGREVLAALRQIRGDVPAVLMSGYTPRDPERAPAAAFLQKPFTPSGLRAVMRKVLNE